MSLIESLAAIVGPADVHVDPEVCARYETDITRRFHGRAQVVVRPGTSAEVAAVVNTCYREGAAIVPQGGNTGLVGGGVPRGGEVVLQLGRLDNLESVDAISAQVTVGAGVTLSTVQEHARASGFEFPIDHGARSGATIGGMVATDAGGTYAIRYGTMRSLVAGLEFVTGDGSIIDRTAGLAKDNAGYQTPSLVIGSEGTLAVITRVRLRLVSRLAHRVTALLAFPSLTEARDAFQQVRDVTPSLTAADFFLEGGMELVCRHRHLTPPFARSHAAYLVLECAGLADPTEELAAACANLDSLADVAVATDSGQRTDLWSYRELHNEVANAIGIPHKADVSVRIPDIPEFAEQVVNTIHAIDPTAHVIVYGHLGDGNVHVSIVGPAPDDDTVDEAVLELVSRFGGSISAEHGVGVGKARHLHLCRSRVEIDLMRRVKSAFDPGGILNPACVLA